MSDVATCSCGFPGCDYHHEFATLGDFTIEFPAGVMRCQLCPVGPGQSRPRAVCSSAEAYTLWQFVFAARDHVREAHTRYRWAP